MEMKLVYWYKKTYRTPRNLSNISGYIEEDNWSIAFDRPLDYMEKNDWGLSFIVSFTPSESEV